MEKDELPLKNSWVCENEKTLISSPILKVIERQCHSSETQKPHTFYILKSRNWCNIIPITEDGKLVMIKQYRVGVSEHTLEVPGGVVDPEDPDCQAAAVREMEEETGYSPLPEAQVKQLGWTFPNPAIMDNRCFSYIVGPVKKMKQQKLDPGEMIEIVEVPIEDIPGLILAGKITHALILNTLFFVILHSKSTAQNWVTEFQQYTQGPV